jgi:hypothetical protein
MHTLIRVASSSTADYNARMPRRWQFTLKSLFVFTTLVAMTIGLATREHVWWTAVVLWILLGTSACEMWLRYKIRWRDHWTYMLPWLILSWAAAHWGVFMVLQIRPTPASSGSPGGTGGSLLAAIFMLGGLILYVSALILLIIFHPRPRAFLSRQALAALAILGTAWFSFYYWISTPRSFVAIREVTYQFPGPPQPVAGATFKFYCGCRPDAPAGKLVQMAALSTYSPWHRWTSTARSDSAGRFVIRTLPGEEIYIYDQWYFYDSSGLADYYNIAATDPQTIHVREPRPDEVTEPSPWVQTRRMLLWTFLAVAVAALIVAFCYLIHRIWPNAL